MKHLAVMITLFCSLAGAQVYQPINGWCQVGGQGVYAAPSGGAVPIQQYTQGSYTGCTISIYNHGTLTLSTIYSNSTGTSLSNPFQANVLGFYQAFATTGVYDVQESGTVNPPVSLGTVSLFDLSSYFPAGGLTDQVQYNCAGLLCGASGLTYNPVNGYVQANAGLNVGGLVTVGSTLSVAGSSTLAGVSATSLSDTGSASVTGLTTILGGIYGGGGIDVQTNVAQTAGGYVQLPPISYPTGLTCLDIFGNQVSIPIPASGMPTFGANDLILWNSLSPLPPKAGSPAGCPTALPPNVTYGINTNGYFFARGGYATDINAFNSFHTFTGGFTGATFESGGFYPPGTVTHCCGTLSNYTYLGGHMAMGHSSGPPSVGTIATVNNPLVGLEGLIQGMFYWDDTLGSAQVYNGSTWGPLGGGSGGSPTGPRYSIQTNSPVGSFYGDLNFTYVPGATNFVTLGTGVFQATGTLGGFDAIQGTAFNTIQAPAGGMAALSLTAVNYVQTGNYSATCTTGPTMTGTDTPHAGALSYCVGTGEYVFNGSAWVLLAGSGTVTHTTGSLTQYAVVVGNGSGDVSVLSSLGTTGYVLMSQGAGTPPIWSNVAGTGTVTHTTGSLTSGLPIFGNGGADIKTGTISGNTTLVMSGGAGGFTSGHAAIFDANGNIVDGGGPSSGFWTTTGSLLYPTSNTYNVLVGRTTDDGTASKLEVDGNVNITGGSIQIVNAACSPAPCTSTNLLQTNDGSGHDYFIVNSNGDLSMSGQLNVATIVSSISSGASAATFASTGASHPTVYAVNTGGGFGFADVLSSGGDYFVKITSGVCTGCGYSNQSTASPWYGTPTSSRAINTIYQNTLSYGIFVVVTVNGNGSGGAIVVKCDGTSTPTTVVAGTSPIASETSVLSFPVPPSYYYSVGSGGGTSIAYWTEYK